VAEPGPGFMTSRPRWVWGVLAALVFIVVWLTVPAWLYRNVTGDTRVKAITDTRTALLAGLIGIEQLGSTGLDVRLGGIYALERIAVDSARDHPTIVEVLSAFVREHSRAPAPSDHPRPTADVQAAITASPDPD